MKLRVLPLMVPGYGFAPLAYRAVVAPAGVAHGLAIFRLRRRGSAIEAALTEVLASDARTERWLLREVRRSSRADYVVRLGASGPHRDGYLPLPNQGPLLVWRAVTEVSMAPQRDWRLSLGDVELF